MFAITLVLLILLPFVVLWKMKLHVSIIEIVVLFLALALLSSITMLPDMENYQLSYEHLLNRGEPGYFVLENFFSSLGLNFCQFYMVCHVASLMLVYLSIKLMSLDGVKCLSLYAFYPFILDVIQIRNGFFMSLALFAFAVCLRCKYKIVEYVVWISFILLASSIHYSAYAFLPAVFLWNSKNWMRAVPIVMFFVSCFLILIDGSALTVLMQHVFSFLNTADDKYDSYMEKKSSLGGFLMMFKSVLMIYVVWFAKEKMSEFEFFVEKQPDFNLPNTKVLDNAYGFLLYSSFFWPLYVISSTFCRLMQNQLIIVYVVFFLFLRTCLSYRNVYNKTLIDDALLKITIPFIVLLIVHSEWVWIGFWDYIIVCLVENLKLFYVFQ